MKGKVLFLGVIVLLVVMLSLPGCGGGATQTVTETKTVTGGTGVGATVTVTNTVPGPTVTKTTTGTAAPSGFTKKFKVASTWISSFSIVAQTLAWEEKITQATNGRYTFENFWGAALFKMGEEAEAVSKGLIDMVVTCTCFYPGEMPLNNYPWGIPFGIADPRILQQVHWELVKLYPQMRAEIEDQYNSKIILTGGNGPYGLQSTKPIRTVADLKGKKIGAVGQFLPSFIDAVGGVGVSSHAAPRYADMQTGVMDGSFLIHEMADDYKYYEVAKYATNVGWGGLWGNPLMVNKDLWNKIPVEDQQLFLSWGVWSEVWSAQVLLAERLGKMFAQWEKAGVTVIDMAPEEIAKWNEMSPFWAYAEFLNSKGLPGYTFVEDYFRLGKEHGYKFAFPVPSRPAGK